MDPRSGSGMTRWWWLGMMVEVDLDSRSESGMRMVWWL